MIRHGLVQGRFEVLNGAKIMLPETFRCYLVDKDSEGNVNGRITEVPTADLPPGEVVVQIDYSSLNYKDALGATGHPLPARQENNHRRGNDKAFQGKNVIDPHRGV